MLKAILSYDDSDNSKEGRIHFGLIKSYIKNKSIFPNVYENKGEKYLSEKVAPDISKYKYRNETIIDTSDFGQYIGLKSNLEFGVMKLLYESAEIYFRCIPDYKRMNLAHAHDDAFHIEVVYSEGRLKADCGSISYTGNIKDRTYYSSNEAHNTVRHRASVLNRRAVFGADSDFEGYTITKENRIYSIVNGAFVHVRMLKIEDDKLLVFDASDDAFNITSQPSRYSFGYGNIINNIAESEIIKTKCRENLNLD